MTAEDPSSQTYALFAVARSSLETASEALKLFQERLPAVLPREGRGLVIEGRTMEWSREGPEQRRGIIGALAFQSSLVMVGKCVERMTRVAGQPPAIVDRAKEALAAIHAVVDRQARNTSEHLDERALRADDQGLIANTIFEGDLFCSTRADGALGMIAVTQATLDAVTSALDRILWPNGLPARQSEQG